jgi:hypothetical protein
MINPVLATEQFLMCYPFLIPRRGNAAYEFRLHSFRAGEEAGLFDATEQGEFSTRG